MYKLLIVDDEPLVQVGIKSMINWADYNVEVIGTAVNGKTALSVIKEQMPDIIITDIKMPVMDGLELIRKVREEIGSDFPDFIVLTSYEDFNMVREAIKYQVTDYLVKVELTSDSLSNAILRSIERVDKYKPSEKIKRSEDVLVENLYDKFFIRLLNNLFDSEEQFKQQAQDLSLNFSYSKFICCYGCLSEETGINLSLDKRLGLFSNSIQMINELVNKYVPAFCIGLDSRHFAIIFCLDESYTADNDVLLLKFDETMKSVQDAIYKYYNMSFSYGIGRPVNRAFNIYESCKMARATLKEKIGEGDKDAGNADNHIVRNVKKYINEHVTERLSLNDVANNFNISPNYLSQLFSKYNDCGFSEYVNICKIKESKELLSKGNLKVYEIADMLGFESSFYFSKVFKKYEGISPTDYLNTI